MKKYLKYSLIAGGIFAAAAGFLAVAGNYYVNTAIKRNKKKYSNKKRQSKKNEGRDPDQFKKLAVTHLKMRNAALEWIDKTEKKELNIISDDGLRLYGELYKNNSEKYVIIVHGYNCTLEDMYPYGPIFYEKGYNVLFIDMRAHGKSEGEYIGMGWLERLDIKLWCRELIRLNENAKILLFGQSMGASAVMMACGEDLPQNVKCAIEDSGYSSVSEMYKILMKEAYHLPAFPLLNAADIVAKRKAGYSFYGANAVSQLKKSDTPMLFIHAEGDTFIPFEMVHTLYASAPEPKELYTVPDAEHVCACFYDKDEYIKRIFDFSDKYMG